MIVVIVQKLVKMGFNRVRGAIGRSLRKQNQNGQVNYMRLKLILPVVEVEKHEKPEECLYGCGGKEFWLRQEVRKPVRDRTHSEVIARRYECLHCHRTFECIRRGSIRSSFRKERWGWR